MGEANYLVGRGECMELSMGILSAFKGVNLFKLLTRDEDSQVTPPITLNDYLAFSLDCSLFWSVFVTATIYI